MFQIQAFFAGLFGGPLISFYVGGAIWAFSYIARLFTTIAWLIPFNWTVWRVLWWGYGLIAGVAIFSLSLGPVSDPSNIGVMVSSGWFTSLVGLWYLQRTGYRRVRADLSGFFNGRRGR
jgi:hypothetical protein